MTEQNQIRAALALKGTNLRQWAIAHGHQYATVHTVLQRWAHRHDRDPLGGLSRIIIKELREELLLQNNNHK